MSKMLYIGDSSKNWGKLVLPIFPIVMSLCSKNEQHTGTLPILLSLATRTLPIKLNNYHRFAFESEFVGTVVQRYIQMIKYNKKGIQIRFYACLVSSPPLPTKCLKCATLINKMISSTQMNDQQSLLTKQTTQNIKSWCLYESRGTISSV